MAFLVSIYSLPKRGLEPSENQDAHWPLLVPRNEYKSEASSEYPDSGFIAAIADGATEGMLSEIWARIVVARASRLFSPHDISNFATASSEAWARYKRRKENANRRLTLLPAWLEEPSLAQGAFSTIAAIRFTDGHTWTAAAVGDSCLFHVRDNKLLLCWPLDASADFAKRPYLLGSEQNNGSELGEYLRIASGRWVVGDHFF